MPSTSYEDGRGHNQISRQMLAYRATAVSRTHLPSDSPYRRRFGTWEDALLHFGFTPESVAERLELGRAIGGANLVPFHYRPGQSLTKRKRGGGV